MSNEAIGTANGVRNTLPVAADDGDASASMPVGDGAAVTILPAASPPAKLDTGAMLALMMIELGFERRKNAKTQREHTEAAIEVANKTELSEMKVAADLKYEAAQIKGWTQIATGAVGIAAAGASFAGYKQGLEVYKNGGEKFNDACGNLYAAHVDHKAAQADIRAKAAEQAGKTAERLNGDVIDDEKNIRESIRKAMDLYKEYVTGVTASQQAAIHRT